MKTDETHEKSYDYGTPKAKAVDQFTFDYEPIRGYPELRWTGKRPFKGTSYFPAQLKESHGDSVDGWRNKLYWGDNLQVMSHLLREYRGKVKLIYIDPPFDSKADYKKKIELRGASASSDASAFEEKQYSDIWTNDEYLQFMYERLILMRELLSEDGSIYVHCDYRKTHHIRCILDEVFGLSAVVNEIIWAYTRPSRLANSLPKVHDTILWYSKTSQRTFNQNEIRIPYDEETLARSNRGAGEESVMGGAEGESRLREGGKVPEDYWVIDEKNIETFLKIPIIQGNALERTEYPTQKPEALLTRILRLSSNPGDLVFDCFMGSGTTQAVALKLGRRFLGADINLGAIQTTTKRLLGVVDQMSSRPAELAFSPGDTTKVYKGFEVYTVNHYDFFRNELEARELLIEALELQKLPGNMLWDGESDGWMVKILAVNRLATAADLNPILSNLDYKAWERRAKRQPEKPVERIRFVCMGHDPDLKAQFMAEMDKLGYKVELQILDILRDKQELQFKREAEAKIVASKKKLEIKKFYPMNLLQKLSLEKTKIADWRELVDSVLIDWNYDGAVFSPTLSDIPGRKELVAGVYDIPEGAGTIHVKITDLLAESWEGNVGD